ncbi:ABC transporter ATP-binding protein [bacterium]|nr:ABC transporter ATP-binding protein [bacterium]MBU1882307.1 ABC transporter ATP-binding protein [bacterium]
MAEVVLKSISKSFNDTDPPVVDNVSFEVKDKEFMVLVGPSGCGKSTTLRIIAGLEEPTSGEIYIAARNVTQAAPKDRDIAMVFQNYALYPHLNVYENMAFSLRLRKFSSRDIESRVQRAAEILGLQQMLKRRPKELSGGQRQRVALGRAIVREPKVFLFDEPLSNLDAKLRVQMRTEILKLHQQLNSTMIYVTHDQMEAMTMGDRIVILKDGIIQQVDTPLTLYHQPVNKFVAGFIGSPSMNFLELTQNNSNFSVNNMALPPKGIFKASANHKFMHIGIRPEKLYLTEDKLHDVAFSATLEVSEKMGHETLHYVRINGSTLIVREMGQRAELPAGSKVKVSFDIEECHVFDERGEAIRTSN